MTGPDDDPDGFIVFIFRHNANVFSDNFNRHANVNNVESSIEGDVCQIFDVRFRTTLFIPAQNIRSVFANISLLATSSGKLLLVLLCQIGLF